jgi:CheY-like chemotaxis protein
MTRVLVIDDERSILRALRINLTARKYEVLTAGDGATGLAAMAQARPDVLILDLGLPDMDGTDVIKDIRGQASTPIIVLTADSEESTKAAALDAGADDCAAQVTGSCKPPSPFQGRGRCGRGADLDRADPERVRAGPPGSGGCARGPVGLAVTPNPFRAGSPAPMRRYPISSLAGYHRAILAGVCTASRPGR